jgi:hypothetical protein
LTEEVFYCKKKIKNMDRVDFSKITQELLSLLKEKEKTVILRRFGLKTGERETLEEIGKNFGITRERVRQIQNKAFSKMREKILDYQYIFENYRKYLEEIGGVEKEEDFLEKWGQDNYKNHVYFLLKLEGKFFRFSGDNQIFPCWAKEEKSFAKHRTLVLDMVKKIEEIGKPLKIEELRRIFPLQEKILETKLKTSRLVGKNEEGFFGLNSWPEINPKGIRDKIYLIFKKVQKPLHFKEIAKLIFHPNVHTVHNELIKDERFVLVGRGIYALRDWGYFPGQVKEVISKILQREQRPMTKEEIIREVLKQRMVKPETILMNLTNKNYFKRDESGRYYLVKEI